MGGNSMNRETQLDLMRIMFQRTAKYKFVDLTLSGAQAKKVAKMCKLVQDPALSVNGSADLP